MVSVNEKYFIEKMACENAVKTRSPLKFFSSKESNSSEKNLKYSTPKDSKGHKYDNSYDVWERSDHEDDWTDGRSGLTSASSSEVSFRSNYSNDKHPKRKIVWQHQVIDTINNILSGSDLNSLRSSLSPEKKRFNVDTNSFQNDSDDECHDQPSDNSWDDLPTSLPLKRNFHQKYPVNKKRFYSKYDDREVNKKSKVKDFSIQPLDANWMYGNIDYDEAVSIIADRMTEIKDWVLTYLPKISLIGDSHTRHLADILSEMLPGFQIEASVKPGAKSKQVLSNLRDVLQYMGENDFVVTLSGTNDMWDETLAEPKSVVYNAVAKARYTNLLLCNIPNNYLERNDSPVHDNIKNFNQFYEDVVNFSKWAHLVDLHQLKDRRFFTRHGLHFNLQGKIRICDLVSNKILDVIDSIKMQE